MMRAEVLHRPSRLLAGCVVLALSGCASEAVQQQLSSSQEAIDQARIAGAAQAAPTEFGAAIDKQRQASAAAERRWGGKDSAMRLSQEAQADANLARARTDAAQARVAAAEVEKSNQILRDAYRTRPNQ